MKLVIGEDKRGPIASSALVLCAVAALVLIIFTGISLRSLGPLFALIILFAVAHRTLLKWRSLVTMIVLTILFIPIRRYTLPASLPFNLEPYRLLVALVAVAWGTSLLIDPRVRLRRTPINAPLVVFALAVIGSDFANRARVSTVQSEVVKKLLFFLSFFIVLYLVTSVVRSFADVDFISRVLAGGGAVVGFFALVERSTGYDVFNHLHTVLPFLHLQAAAIPQIPTRGGRLRVFASAQHPIALGAALAMLVPIAMYRAISYSRGRWRWLAAAMFLTLGSLSTGSRTAVVMFVIIVLTYLRLRRRQVTKFWPAIIPALLLIHFGAPGSLGTVRSEFFPKGGLIAQQADASVGSGRLATLGPALRAEFVPNPLLGEGFGTRVTTATPTVPRPNAPILDDQWLGILLETGVVGTAALVWLFIRFVRRLVPAAKEDDGPRGWYLVGIIGSVAGFAVSMFFYDAFSFIQVTLFLFILMGLGSSALAADPQPRRRTSPVPTGRPSPTRPLVAGPAAGTTT